MFTSARSNLFLPSTDTDFSVANDKYLKMAILVFSVFLILIKIVKTVHEAVHQYQCYRHIHIWLLFNNDDNDTLMILAGNDIFAAATFTKYPTVQKKTKRRTRIIIK